MKHVNLTFSKPAIPTINCLGLGVFDGIHQGHQQLLKEADALLTFEPHPITILKNIQVNRLTTKEELPFYIPQLFTLEFTKDIATMSSDDFLNDIILKKINPKKIVVGYDYHYGHKKEGNIATLKQWGTDNHIDIIEINPFTINNIPIKSRLIRKTLTEDNFNQGIEWLGHSYLIKGTVIKGDGRGKTIGFPTANIAVSTNKCIPQYGVYKGTTTINQTSYNAMIYIGNKPTFNHTHRSIEVHILNFDQDIYNQTIDVFLEKKIRDHQKFDSTETLIAQIKDDINLCYEP